MNLYERIKEIRTRKRLKQSDIAKALELDPAYYSRLEKRGDKMTIEQVKAIAMALDVSLSELLGLDVPVENEEKVKELEGRIYFLEEKNKYLSAIDEFTVKGVAYDIIRFYRINTPEHLDHPLYENIEQSPYCRLKSDDETKEKIQYYIKFKQKESTLYSFVGDLIPFQEIEKAMNSWDVIYDHSNISQHVKKKHEESDELFKEAAGFF